MVFEETTEAYMYDCIYRFQFLINKNEIEICEIEMHLKNFLFALKRFFFLIFFYSETG